MPDPNFAPSNEFSTDSGSDVAVADLPAREPAGSAPDVPLAIDAVEVRRFVTAGAQMAKAAERLAKFMQRMSKVIERYEAAIEGMEQRQTQMAQMQYQMQYWYAGMAAQQAAQLSPEAAAQSPGFAPPVNSASALPPVVLPPPDAFAEVATAPVDGSTEPAPSSLSDSDSDLDDDYVIAAQPAESPATAPPPAAVSLDKPGPASPTASATPAPATRHREPPARKQRAPAAPPPPPEAPASAQRPWNVESPTPMPRTVAQRPPASAGPRRNIPKKDAGTSVNWSPPQLDAKTWAGIGGAAVLLIGLLAYAFSPSSPGVMVEGTVTFDGTPVKDGRIVFAPLNGQGQDDTGPIRDGKFSFRALNTGKRRVRIIAGREVPGKFTETDDGGKIPVMEWYIPKQYNVESKLEEDVKSGKPFTFSLVSAQTAT